MHLGQTQDVSAGFGQHLGYENKNKLSLLIIYILNIWSGGWKSVITELNQKPWKQKTYNKTILRNFSYRLREPFIINHSYIYICSYPNNFTRRWRNLQIDLGIETAATEHLLHVRPGTVVNPLPPLLCQLILLLPVHPQAGARDWELNEEQQKQNDHVLCGVLRSFTFHI